MGELIRSTMIMAVVDRQIDLDISSMQLPCKLLVHENNLRLYNTLYGLTSSRWRLDGMTFYITTSVRKHLRWS